MRRFFDVLIKGYTRCKDIIIKNTVATKDFVIKISANKLFISRSDDISLLKNYVSFNADTDDISVYENMICQKIIKILSANPQSIYDTTEATRVGKNFQLYSSTHSGDTSKSGLLLRKLNGASFVSSLYLVDWDSGEITNYTKHSFPVIQLGSSSAPTAIKGGLYFNTTNNTWYKCSDGSTWVVANI